MAKVIYQQAVTKTIRWNGIDHCTASVYSISLRVLIASNCIDEWLHLAQFVCAHCKNCFHFIQSMLIFLQLHSQPQNHTLSTIQKHRQTHTVHTLSIVMFCVVSVSFSFISPFLHSIRVVCVSPCNIHYCVVLERFSLPYRSLCVKNDQILSKRVSERASELYSYTCKHSYIALKHIYIKKNERVNRAPIWFMQKWELARDMLL